MKRLTMMKWWLCLCSLVLGFSAFGQDYYEVNRSVTKSFAWVDNTRLELENKYGDVIFETWERDSVRVQVQISIKSKKSETAQELADMAVVEIYNQGSFVIARTDWGANTSMWNHARNEMRNVFGADQKVEISYKVWLPETTSIEVINKFGDVYLPAFKGEVIMDVSHGDLRSPMIDNPHNIKVEYGTVKVDEWGVGKLKLLFAELHADEIPNLNIESKSSKLYIKKAGVLSFDSRNDELYLDEVTMLLGQFHFTSTDVKMVKRSIDITQSYGDLNVKSLSSEYESVIIKPRRSKITLRLDAEVPTNFYVYLTNGERFASVPELITITSDEDLEELRKIEGYWGGAGSVKSIRIEGEKSVIELAKQ